MFRHNVENKVKLIKRDTRRKKENSYSNITAVVH